MQDQPVLSRSIDEASAFSIGSASDGWILADGKVGKQFVFSNFTLAEYFGAYRSIHGGRSDIRHRIGRSELIT